MRLAFDSFVAAIDIMMNAASVMYLIFIKW